MLRTRENSDVFNSLDEIYLVFTPKKQISLYNIYPPYIPLLSWLHVYEPLRDKMYILPLLVESGKKQKNHVINVFELTLYL